MALDNSKRITTDLLCLHLLMERDMYVYEMSQEIERRSDGLLSMTEAAIYMSMYRLVENGCITDRREMVGKKARMRVYYHLTDAGKEYYHAIREDYWRSVGAMQSFFGFGGDAHE